VLNEWDKDRDRLRELHPGWRIWYVPRLDRGGGIAATWCAQQEPTLNCGSPAELSAAIAEVADSGGQDR
jgi:hypothetical protein